MRARWLKASFFGDRKIGQLGIDAALVYEALWCYADDTGVAQCDADRVKGDLFMVWPEMTLPRISEALRRLAAAGRIIRYRVGDDTYCEIPTFPKHQKVHNPSKFFHPKRLLGVLVDTPESLASPPEDLGISHGLDVQGSLGSGVQKEQLLTDSQKTLVGSREQNGSHRENGKAPALPAQPAVSAVTAPGGNGADVSRGTASKLDSCHDPVRALAGARDASAFPAAEGSLEALSTIHIPDGFTEYLLPKSVLCKDLGESTSTNTGGVDGCGEGGGQDSEEPPSRQASLSSTAISGNGTGCHSVCAVDTNPVAGNDSRQILPVPVVTESFPQGDAKGLPPETPPAGLKAEKQGRAKVRAKQKEVLADGAARATWITPIEKAWEEWNGAGSFASLMGEAQRRLAPLYKAHGADTVAAHVGQYLSETDREPQFRSLTRFAQNFNAYTPKPLVNEWGMLTEYGERVTRP